MQYVQNVLKYNPVWYKMNYSIKKQVSAFLSTYLKNKLVKKVFVSRYILEKIYAINNIQFLIELSIEKSTNVLE